jgi:hypothetical protein
LHVSSGTRGRDGSETGAPHRGSRRRVVYLVERIEQLTAELKVTPLGKRELFGNADVPLLILLLCIPAFAQTGVANGSIEGAIHDPSNTEVTNAAVKARNLDTGFERG